MMKKMPEKTEELREAFKTFDADGDGCTTRSELRRVMIKFGQNLTDPELDAVMLEVDKNRDGHFLFRIYGSNGNLQTSVVPGLRRFVFHVILISVQFLQAKLIQHNI